jgi:hypothetical protein
VTLGEAWRSPEEAARLAKTGKGIARSLHTERLAIDLNLFKSGQYLFGTEDHRELGEWWEAQDALARWGGRFNGTGITIASPTAGGRDVYDWEEVRKGRGASGASRRRTPRPPNATSSRGGRRASTATISA